MTDKEIVEVLERVRMWPKERQEAAAEVLMDMEAKGHRRYRLTDEQVAEVKRRFADPNPEYIPIEEVEAYFARRRDA